MSVVKPERIKAYKDREPLDTVEEIKRILKDMDIKTSETRYYNPQADVYSCNVFISGAELEQLQIGTNGKGMSEEYSLASGYAEFMERLQNGILFGLDNDSFFDGEILETEDCREDITTFFRDNFGEHEKASKWFISNYNSFRMLPFTSADGMSRIRIPADIMLRLCTSNGMCAGNSFKEAVIQGVSEIFERYAQRRIIMEKLCPPVVPYEYFEGSSIFEKLTRLSKCGVSFEIRDCSLGIGLPVIGVYMKLGDGRELFHLGADPSPVTSLERCLTEIFQGIDSINEAEFHEPDTNDHDEMFWKYQLQLASWGGNIYPKELSGKKYDWKFEGFNHSISISNDDDFIWYLSIIERLGKTLYIRDMSFTGFPAYWCYIPELSVLDFSSDDGEEIKNFFEYSIRLKNARRLPLLNEDELRQFTSDYSEYLDSFWYYETDNYARRFFPSGFKVDDNTDMYCILAYLYAACGMKAEAADAMENHMVSAYLTDEDEAMCEEFIECMFSGTDSSGNGFNIPKQRFPVCLDCGSCKVRERCYHKQLLALIEKVRKYYAFQKTK